ncbi:MAG: nitrilase-related carbon-nitrogen hydrolase [Bacteroidota bacterium]|nr:nitrilase-related carbon-nitrogen hydrolase [Bacteroidota bacterium]
MKITLIQPDIIWEDKVRNLEKLTGMVDTIPSDTEIVILPEMFNTGFSMNPDALSEAPRSLTFDWMKSMAEKGSFGICGSYIVKEGSYYFNRWIFVVKSGDICQYDKRHLFSPGNEDKLFTPGKKRVVFNFRGINICPIICYDLRFPVWCRVKNDYDMLIDSANWPGSRRDVWLTLLKARALENMSFVAGVNRIGTDGTGTKHCGDSTIFGPKGNTIASAGRDKEGNVSGEISVKDLFDFRKKFPVLDDADKFRLFL